LRRHLTAVAIATAFLLVVGCQKEPPEEHLVEIAVKLEKQQRQLDRMDTAVESIGEALREIEGRSAAGPAVEGAGAAVT